MDALMKIVAEAEVSNYKLGRITETLFDNSQDQSTDLYFFENFNENYFLSLVSDVIKLDLNQKSIKNLSNDEILSSFGLLEKTLWYYNDNLRNNRYKIKNLYVLLSIFFCQLHDYELKYLTNRYNNIVQELPLSGVIMISHGCILLVKNNFSRTWSYPKGKIGKSETPLQAAIRECWEETGYDITQDIDPNNVIIKKYNKKMVYLYVIKNIPYNYPFKPQSSNEIIKIKWFPLNNQLSSCRLFNIYINKSYTDLLNLMSYRSS